MANSFAMPGQAFRVDSQIARQYGNGAAQAPYVPVLTGPAGQRVTAPATAAVTARVRRPGPRHPGVRIADYATMHNRAFVTRDGRSTFALVFTPPRPGSAAAPSAR